MEIDAIQLHLRDNGLDGWLLADFHARNDLMISLLGIKGMLTRRSFYFIPSNGDPTALVNPIEQEKFRSLPGQMIQYFGYKNLERELKNLLSDSKRIAMEYSPHGRLPYIGLVDAGTIELVRDCNVEIVSSADLVASFQARLSSEQVTSHKKASQNLIDIKSQAFDFIAESLKSDVEITEHDVCLFVQNKYEEHGMVTSSGPICAVDGHAGDPHYEPSERGSAIIKKGQLILIDMWAKLEGEQAVYGDITWMAFAGKREEIPSRLVELFDVIVRARDTAIAFLNDQIGKRDIYGYEVDDECRNVVVKSGYGEFFTHRTGHSITTSEHGPGPNIDNLETEDRRILQAGHLFSIEPGIYMEDCGFRTEIDMLITEKGCEVTTLPLQSEILPLF